MAIHVCSMPPKRKQTNGQTSGGLFSITYVLPRGICPGLSGRAVGQSPRPMRNGIDSAG